MPNVFYICDCKKSCNTSPSCCVNDPEGCSKTSDITHAMGFMPIRNGKGDVVYYEEIDWERLIFGSKGDEICNA